jgi:hypothetical protein
MDLSNINNPLSEIQKKMSQTKDFSNKAQDLLDKNLSKYKKMGTSFAQNKATSKAERKLRKFGLHKSADTILSIKTGRSSQIHDGEDYFPLQTSKIDCSNKTKNNLAKCNEQNKDIDQNSEHGVYGDYLRCSSTMSIIDKNFVFDLSKKYKIIKTLGGGKSGAYVFLVQNKDTKKEYILKLYALRILGMIQDRDVREIFTTCALSGSYGCPIVHDYGTTQYNNKIQDDQGFWKKFKESYIDCVPEKEKTIKNTDFYTRVYYLVTEKVGGSPLSNINLVKYKPHELINILYQLAIIFKDAQDKLPSFLHNDLHPGNIFIDDDFRDQNIYFDNNTTTNQQQNQNTGTGAAAAAATASTTGLNQIMGPKVNIIDFDLAVTDEYPKNLAKLRQYAGKFFVQEALIKMLSEYFGLKNTYQIIKYTAKLWKSKDIVKGGRDDFRLWYIYKILFEIIMKITIDNTFNSEITIIQNTEMREIGKKLHGFQNPDSHFEISGESIYAFPNETIKTIIKGYYASENYDFVRFEDFIEFIRSNNNLLKDGNDYFTKLKIFTESRPQQQPSQVPVPGLRYQDDDTNDDNTNDDDNTDEDLIDEIQNMNSPIDLLKEKLKNLNKLINGLCKKNNIKPVCDFVKKAIDELDKKTLETENQHFGLHNIKCGIEINFGQPKEIVIPLYDDKGGMTDIKLKNNGTNKDIKIGVLVDDDNLEIILNNIILNKTLLTEKIEGSMIKMLTWLFTSNINKIIIKRENGKIEIPEALVSTTINSLFQKRVNEMLNCPGIKFNFLDFIENTFPFIETLLKYLYDTNSIKDTKLIICHKKYGNNEKYKDIKGEQNINIIGIINDIREYADDEIKNELIKQTEQFVVTTPTIDNLKKNYENKERERKLLKSNQIEDATSLQGMINNLMITQDEKKKIKDNRNENMFNMYKEQIHETIKNIYKILHGEIINNEKKRFILSLYKNHNNVKKYLIHNKDVTLQDLQKHQQQHAQQPPSQLSTHPIVEEMRRAQDIEQLHKELLQTKQAQHAQHLSSPEQAALQAPESAKPSASAAPVLEQQGGLYYKKYRKYVNKIKQHKKSINT